MSKYCLSRFNALSCAPAVVVLATVVNAAASQPQILAPQSSAADLTWVVKGGAACSTARAYFAQKAATTIHSLDRLCGAQTASASQFKPLLPLAAEIAVLNDEPRGIAQRHSNSTQQHSAP